MIHEGKPICESLVILRYIDEVWTDGPSIRPPNPSDRAMARFWAAYVDDELWPTMKGIRVAKGEVAKAAALEQVMEVMMLLEDAFAKCGKGKDFFGGDTIGYLDIAIGSFLSWMRATEKVGDVKVLDKTKTPGLFGWAERFSSNVVVKDVIYPTTGLSFPFTQQAPGGGGGGAVTYLTLLSSSAPDVVIITLSTTHSYGKTSSI